MPAPDKKMDRYYRVIGTGKKVGEIIEGNERFFPGINYICQNGIIPVSPLIPVTESADPGADQAGSICNSVSS
jgi:hypothetical protein